MKSRLMRSVTGSNSKLPAAATGSLGARLIGLTARFALQIVLAQALGTAGYGRFVTFRRWGELLAVLPNRGYQGVTVRFLPDYETSRAWPQYRALVGRSLRLTVWGAVVTGVVAAVVGSTVFGADRMTIALAFGAVPAWAALRILQSILQAQHQYITTLAIIEILQPLVLGLGLGLVWLVGSSLSIDGALALVLLSLMIAVAAAALSMRASTPDAARQGPASSETPLWATSAKRFYVSQIAIATIGMADILILAMFVPSTDVALYAIALRVALVGRLANSGVEAIVSPRISAAWTNNDLASIQQTVNHSIAVTLLPTVGFAVLLTVFASPVLSIVGSEYREASSVLVILLIGNLANAITGPSGYVVSLTDNEAAHARAMSAAAVLLVVLSFAVAGVGGIVAIAWVRTGIDVLWNVILAVFARRKLGIRCYPNPGILDGLRHRRDDSDRTTEVR